MAADDGDLWAGALRPVRPRGAARRRGPGLGNEEPAKHVAHDTIGLLAAIGSLQGTISELVVRITRTEARLDALARAVGDAALRPGEAAALVEAVRSAVRDEIAALGNPRSTELAVAVPAPQAKAERAVPFTGGAPRKPRAAATTNAATPRGAHGTATSKAERPAQDGAASAPTKAATRRRAAPNPRAVAPPSR